MFRYLLVILIYCKVQVYCSNTTIDNVTSENELWFGLVRNCKEPTIPCIKNTIHDFLKNTFDYGHDVNFTSFLKFTKNKFNYKDADNETDTISRSVIQNETPFEEISRSLRENAKKFFMTHDLELLLPEGFFLGTTLKVSPRSLDDNGTLFKVDLVPRELTHSIGQGRIFNNLIGNFIKKFITDRLLYALLAALVIIKLLAVNALFFLPSMLGVVTAKKIIVKILLFFFPVLHHLFKLCEYTPYGAKHHIHKHQIAHIHQVAPGHHHHKPHVDYHKPHLEVEEHEYHPSHYHHHDSHYPPGEHEYHPSGPPDIGHYSEFAHKDDSYYGGDDSYPASSYGNEVYHKDPDDEGDSWDHSPRQPKPNGKKRMTVTEIENMVLKAEKEALIKSRLQKERQRIHEENLKLQEQLNTAIKIQQKLKYHAAAVGSKKKINPHHLLAPLVPPPLPATTNQFPQSQFAKPVATTFLTQNVAHSVSGEFAEPPLDYVQPEKNFVKPPKGYAEQVQPSKISESYPAIAGPGLPGDTVQAIQSLINRKVGQNEQKVYQMYPTNQNNDINSLKSSVKTFSTKPGVPTQTSVAADRKSDRITPEEEFYKAASITYDAFYSPILEKIDAILNGISFYEEPCKERLICSMYKKPEKFSPHSNLISAELSRDQKELQKPKATNAAVIRFYKYVQAARDGQDQKDCVRLYPTCAINTEI